jgi:hypothetical protein
MMLRTSLGRGYQTPATIPVDVTEHFRERLFAAPWVLVGEPLVNYAETLSTARTTKDATWSTYQCMLIGSTFAALRTEEARLRLADRLWMRCLSPTAPRATALLMSAAIFPEARAIARRAPWLAVARFAVWAARRAPVLYRLRELRIERRAEFEFLCEAPLTRSIADEST